MFRVRAALAVTASFALAAIVIVAVLRSGGPETSEALPSATESVAAETGGADTVAESSTSAVILNAGPPPEAVADSTSSEPLATSPATAGPTLTTDEASTEPTSEVAAPTTVEDPPASTPVQTSAGTEPPPVSVDPPAPTSPTDTPSAGTPADDTPPSPTTVPPGAFDPGAPDDDEVEISVPIPEQVEGREAEEPLSAAGRQACAFVEAAIEANRIGDLDTLESQIYAAVPAATAATEPPIVELGGPLLDALVSPDIADILNDAFNTCVELGHGV